jgi:Domain of unknown function (DUF1877)
MSIFVNYQRISTEKFAEIQNDRKLAEDFFEVERLENLDENEASICDDFYDPTKTILSIEKEWEAINYLLTGEILSDEKRRAESLLMQIINGGTPTKFAGGDDLRYFTSNEVKEISQALQQVAREDLRARFDTRNDREIYAQLEWGEEEWEMLLSAIDVIVCFFNVAATNGEVILITSY